MSDTPRTDNRLTAILDSDGFVHQGNCPQRWVNHSRELERELNVANAIIRQQQLLDEENLRLQERIKRLEEAGDELVGTADAMDAWRKAKEDKP